MNVLRFHVDRARMRLGMTTYIYICKDTLHTRGPGPIDMCFEQVTQRSRSVLTPRLLTLVEIGIAPLLTAIKL